jgi:hypothetical protein
MVSRRGRVAGGLYLAAFGSPVRDTGNGFPPGYRLCLQRACLGCDHSRNCPKRGTCLGDHSGRRADEHGRHRGSGDRRFSSADYGTGGALFSQCFRLPLYSPDDFASLSRAASTRETFGKISWNRLPVRRGTCAIRLACRSY